MYSRCDKAFVNCKNLESFTVDTWSGVNVIRTILEANKKLKILKLYESLFFKELYFNRDYLQNFNQFLITQRDSLETMKLGQWMNVQVFETILSMSRLKKLFLGLQILHPLTDGSDFSRSQSIIDLELSDFHSESVMECTVFLQAFPNLKYLKISRTYNELGDAISVTCKSLKELYIQRFEVSKILNIEFFSKLEEFTCFYVVKSSKTLYESIRTAKENLIPNPFRDLAFFATKKPIISQFV